MTAAAAATPEPTFPPIVEPTPELLPSSTDSRSVEDRLRDLEVICADMHAMLSGLVRDAEYVKTEGPKVFEVLHQQVSGTLLGKALGL